MELGATEHVSQNSKLFTKQTQEDQAKVSFKNEMVSKINLNASIVAAEEVHKQSMMKTKKKKTYKDYESEDEEELTKQKLKKLKQKLTNLLNSERHISGI